MENPFQIISERLDNIERLLIELKNTKRHSNNEIDQLPELMSIHQLSKYLSLANQTIYTFTSKHLIPYFKKGKRLYFRKSEIDAWISNGRRKTISEIEQEIRNDNSNRKRH